MLCLSLDLRGFCAFFLCFLERWRRRRPLSRRRVIWLGGSCPRRRDPRSPWGAGRLLFQACCRARSTGVRPPPLASFGDIALGVRQSCKTKLDPVLPVRASWSSAAAPGSRRGRVGNVCERARPFDAFRHGYERKMPPCARYQKNPRLDLGRPRPEKMRPHPLPVRFDCC